ncbi:MAG: TldD/PmbA family protein [Candidatus Methanomethylophilaceae archaeon]
MMQMDSIADEALRYGKKFDDSEVYVVRTFSNTVYVESTKISNVETKTDSGLSFRMAKDHKLGKASVTLNGKSTVAGCVDMAERIASFSPSNSGFKGYVMPSRAKISTSGIWDKKVENITHEQMIEIVKSIADNVEKDVVLGGLLRVSTIEALVANSNGVHSEHSSTLVYGHFTSMARKEHPGEGQEAIHGTQLSIDTEEIGRSLSQRAVSAAKAKPFRGSRRLTMILPPGELGDMLMSSAGSALNGENVFYGRSLWQDKIGEKIASDSLSLTDDPTVEAPLASAFDDEGTPTEKRKLVEKGVLRSYIRDSFVGESTGNGMRRSSVDAQGLYERSISIKPINMVVTPGKMTRDQIVEQTDSGILIDKFAWPEADPLTGRFGLEVRCGHLIEKGKIVGTINNALMIGNMMDALSNIENIGNDQKIVGLTTIPTMSFSGMDLVGN